MVDNRQMAAPASRNSKALDSRFADRGFGESL